MAATLRKERPDARREHRKPVSLRIPEEALDLLDQAAAYLHEDRTTFMLHAAVERAHDVLRDQTVFRMAPENFERFVAALDNPAPPPTEAMKALLRETPPWEQE